MNPFKKMRKKANLTQAAVAEKLNITQSAVSQWELGSAMPQPKMLPKIAKLYKCRIEDLLKEPEESV